MDQDEDQVVAPCSSCRKYTFHDVVHSVDVGGDPEETYTGPETALGTFRMIQCKGCGQVSMSHHGQYTDDGSDMVFYPSPAFRKPPLWWTPWLGLTFGDEEVSSSVSIKAGDIQPALAVLGEVYQALGGGQYRLAFMGIRALFEQMMVLQVGDQGTFAQNLKVYCEQGYLSRVQRDAMSAILDAGHAVTHRLFNPTEDDLRTALDIAEGIFAAIYVHPDGAAKIANRVPPRKRKAGKGQAPQSLITTS